MKIENNELMLITGGGISGTLINSVVKLTTLIVDLGRAVGSAIRNATSGMKCKY